MRITDFLGQHVSSMLNEEPFKNWPVEKSVDDDLDEKVTNYVFREHGLAMCSDQNDKISVIFLFSDKYNGFDEKLFEIPFSTNRKRVIEYFGMPSKNGGELSDPTLGEYGAWDRFTRPDCTIHVEYRRDCDAVKMFTLMRNDVVP